MDLLRHLDPRLRPALEAELSRRTAAPIDGIPRGVTVVLAGRTARTVQRPRWRDALTVLWFVGLMADAFASRGALRRALRALLRWAAGDGGSVVVRVTPQDGGWRFSARGPSLDDDSFDAVVDSVFPLADGAAAQDKMLRSDFFGKILLEPPAR